MFDIVWYKAPLKWLIFLFLFSTSDSFLLRLVGKRKAISLSIYLLRYNNNNERINLMDYYIFCCFFSSNFQCWYIIKEIPSFYWFMMKNYQWISQNCSSLRIIKNRLDFNRIKFVIELWHEIKPKIEQNISDFYIPFF